MPFLKAGFNAHNVKTGIIAQTTRADGHGRAAWVELRRFECGDYFWLGVGKADRVIAWGEACHFLTRHELRGIVPWRAQYDAAEPIK